MVFMLGFGSNRASRVSPRGSALRVDGSGGGRYRMLERKTIHFMPGELSTGRRGGQASLGRWPPHPSVLLVWTFFVSCAS